MKKSTERPNQRALTIPPQQWDRLNALSEQTGQTRSELIRQAIEEFLKKRLK